MAILGVRVEFYDKVGDVGEPSKNLVGAIYRDHGFRAAGVPHVGELFSLTSLRVGPREEHVALNFTGHGPFLPVRAVEHYAMPIDDDGQAPAWWGDGYEPSANVVLHTTLTEDDFGRRRLLKGFAAPDSGWVGSFPYGSGLDTLWYELSTAQDGA